jgi:segregation and condensation protein B
MEPQLVKRIVEAALLAASQPMGLAQLTALFAEGEPAAADAVAQAITELQADCAERGVELVEVASGFRFQVRQDVHPYVSRLWTERQTKYSRALLETLALIAYRQPITRAEIEQIRGVVVSASIVRTLEEREWIRVVGHRDVPGRPALFGTTRQFLDYFNLKSLDELPPLAEIRDLEELEPQLPLPEAGLPSPPLVPVDPAMDALAADNGVEAEADVEAESAATEPVGAAGDADISPATEPGVVDDESPLPAEDAAGDDALNSPGTPA